VNVKAGLQYVRMDTTMIIQLCSRVWDCMLSHQTDGQIIEHLVLWSQAHEQHRHSEALASMPLR
jgi:hypothetical protein